jgi:tetratricopeptide (TPR) repeat protein
VNPVTTLIASATASLARLALWSLLLASAAAAQALPPLDLAYLDADAASADIARIDAEDAGQRSALESQLRRDPRNPLLRLQQAQVFADRGMRQRVGRELATAERLADPGSPAARVVQYHAGWIQFRLGDFQAAAGHWDQARIQHGGAPSWVPLTYALLLWTQGDRAAALRYYERAATDRPELFGRESTLDLEVLAQLRPGERFALESMRDAWLRGDS